MVDSVVVAIAVGFVVVVTVVALLIVVVVVVEVVAVVLVVVVVGWVVATVVGGCVLAVEIGSRSNNLKDMPPNDDLVLIHGVLWRLHTPLSVKYVILRHPESASHDSWHPSMLRNNTIA